MKKCARDGCNVEFTSKKHNQKYCSPECCRIATNARIMREYYASRARLGGKVRICGEVGCNAKLSRYNKDKVCSSCLAARRAAESDKLLRMLREAGINK
jgi:hypothetical protein